jgi:hypothetical protein
MPIVHRNFTYKGVISVSSDDLNLVHAGVKTCTIRLGVLNVESEVITLTDRRRSVKVRIRGIDNSRIYSQLSEEDALCEGLSSVDELRRDLSRYYRNIDPAQPITIIYFEMLDD